MTETVKCPRCESTEIQFITRSTIHGDADQSRCHDCDHEWGDGFPDEAGRPLPEGFADCSRCDGSGGDYALSCYPCEGRGIVQTALLG